MPTVQLLFLVGPTGSGKNVIAQHIVASLNAEIISVDSMKIYQKMNIGTAKPLPSQLKKYNYHLASIIKPSVSYNVAAFVQDCKRVINEIISRQRQPLLVGGTPLYMKALLQGLFSGPTTDPKIRLRLKSLAEQKGGLYLYNELKKVDSVKADQVHPNDIKRIIRALEVYELTGQPISGFQTQFTETNQQYHSIMIGLQHDREDLYQRINQRVEKMFNQGLVEETQQLLKDKILGLQSKESLGYKEVAGYLKGEVSLQNTIELVKRNTRHMARKQLAWFRRFSQIKWIQIKSSDTIEKISRSVLDSFLKLSKAGLSQETSK